MTLNEAFPITDLADRLVPTLRALLGPQISVRGIRVVIDLVHYKPIAPEERDAIETTLGPGIWILGDEGIAYGIRRITFQVGGSPPWREDPNEPPGPGKVRW